MTRLNLILLVVLALCALGLVSSQHKARKLFAELEREQARAQQIDVEWGQLQLEQSTWAMHSRIDKLAKERLRMRNADPKRIQIIEAQGPLQLGAAQ